MSSSKPRAWVMRSGCRPTGSCRTRSGTCSSGRSGDRRMRYAASTPASAIRRRAGRNPAGWWPRLSGIRANCIRASALSSPTWRGRPSASWPSTISAAPRSSGSRKGRQQSGGRACHAVLSLPTRFAFSSMPGLQSRQFHANAGDAQGGGAMVADQPAGKADQDRRQGGQPRPLRHVSDGRGCGAATDVPRHSPSDRPAAGAARASMRVAGQMRQQRGERCVLMPAEQWVSAPRSRSNRGFRRLRPARSATYRCKAARRADLGPQRPRIRGMSVYMQLHLDVFPPGLAPTLAAVKDVAEAARKGEGNLRYDVVQSVKTPLSHMTLFAAWQSRKAFDSYEMSDYARQFRDKVGPLLGSPFDDRLYVLID